MLSFLEQLLAKFVIGRLVKRSLVNVPAAINAHVNVSTLLFVVYDAIKSGGGVGAVEKALIEHVSDVVPAADVPLVASGLVFLSELQRRSGNGPQLPPVAVKVGP